MSRRGGGAGAHRGGAGGFRGRGAPRGGRGGARGGFGNFGPPDQVFEMGAFLHSCEGDMVCRSTNAKIPYFNAPIYLENKSQIGKVEEILGPMNEVYFTVKLQENIAAASFKANDKVYIAGDKLLPLERFLPKPKAPAGGIQKRGGLQGMKPARGGAASRGRGAGRGGARGAGGRGGFAARGGRGAGMRGRGAPRGGGSRGGGRGRGY
ncbi:MAG: Gar1/Naf1 RNA binding region-domain-containing protein [Olpidium bornovanus]|uniref:H/ACA ribonucleoprotein complex subunit n=1 Tax=Olpidium bornovanus TaxID=278681 RepID=A0A8H7ZTR4_9FUNG|nr:MAG: Gar1/Naf1 RNA binding region-domain-containing protein [Olpidium bornovanus]